jgi:hypothetical protein
MPKVTKAKTVRKSAKSSFIPMYGGKKGGKMSNGAGWGGERPGTVKMAPKKVVSKKK